MQFKPFFVHYRAEWNPDRHAPRAMTAYVAPGKDRDVAVRIAFCSNKDQFCKRSGRDAALAIDPVTINGRNLGRLLSEEINKRMFKKLRNPYAHAPDFDYLYKYMV